MWCAVAGDVAPLPGSADDTISALNLTGTLVVFPSTAKYFEDNEI